MSKSWEEQLNDPEWLKRFEDFSMEESSAVTLPRKTPSRPASIQAMEQLRVLQWKIRAIQKHLPKTVEALGAHFIDDVLRYSQKPLAGKGTSDLDEAIRFGEFLMLASSSAKLRSIDEVEWNVLRYKIKRKYFGFEVLRNLREEGERQRGLLLLIRLGNWVFSKVIWKWKK